MGKRIPKSKRHKKLKFVDPCYKGPRHHSKKKHLFNEPPADDDAQEVPGGMRDFLTNQKRTKKKKKKAYKDDFIIVKTEVEENQPGMEKPIKKMPKMLKQRKGEVPDQFINRLQNMADKALAEAKIEEKYNIELLNVDKEGNAQYRCEDKKTSEGKKRKRQKYKEKLKEKKKVKTEDREEFELKKDKITFGEIVEAPPILSAKPRRAPELNKPGKKNLKLKDSLSDNHQSKNTNLDRRKEIENERWRAIQMYRLLKKKKNTQFN